ncbi:hypothetical protein Tco_1571670, partial [Tanacetum coccineum]
TIYVSLIHQFWQTASASTSENGEMEINATIDGRVKTVTEASIRRHLKLEDSNGITTLPTTEIFEQLALMSPKKTAWEQFSSNIATAIICLATNRTFNFSKMIFEGMVKNLDRSTILFESHHTPTSAPSTSQPPTTPPSMQTTHVAEEVATLPHDSPLPRVHLLRSDEGTLYEGEKVGEKVKLNKARRRGKIVVSDDEDAGKDTSKQGRSMIEDIDQDAGVTLVQIDAKDHERFEDETDT